MMLLLFALLGGLLGRWVHYYLSSFMNILASEVWQAYQSIFAEQHQASMPFFAEQFKPMKCGHFVVYMLGFAILAILCYCLILNVWQGLICVVYFVLGFCIARLDFTYQLIPPHLCQGLFALGQFSAWLGIGQLTLAQSMQSAVIGFVSFHFLALIAKRYYGKEALGQGDCWLMLGLGSFIHWQQLPLLVFLACLLGLGYAAYQKWHGKIYRQIPFGPFLVGGGFGLLLLNWFQMSMILPQL